MTIKTYKTRDSAVSVLRKAGVAKCDYSSYITYDGELFVLTLSETGGFVMPDTVAETQETETVETTSDIPAGGETMDEEETVEELLARSKARNAENTKRLSRAEAVAAGANPFSGLGKREETPAPKPLTKAEKAAAKKAEKEAAAAIIKAAKKPAVKKEAKVKPAAKASNKNGISAYIRGLIEAGKTNAEILESAKADGHDLTGKKRYFPAWYRFDMKRKAAALAAKTAE